MARAAGRPLSPADALWLDLDRPDNLMVIVAVVLLRDPPHWPDVLAVVSERMVARHPVFAQVPRAATRRWGRPRWHDDAAFDLERHVHRTTLPGPGTDATLQAYIETHLHLPLDRSRPLWEVHLVDGHGGGAALVFRIHHALADGMALTRVLIELTDPLPEGQDSGDGGVLDREGDVAPRRVRGRTLGPPRHRLSPARRALTRVTRLVPTLGQLILTTNPKSDVGGTPGHRKRVLWTAPLPLEGLKQAGRDVDATLNDVLLSGVAGALHTYQVEQGAEPVDLVTMVPVNLRPLDRPLPRALGNRFALLFLPLPSGTGTTLRRLVETKRRMDWLKGSPEVALTTALIAVIGRTTGRLERVVVDFFADKAIGVTTNVAGPREPRRLAGVDVDGVLGWVPGSGRHTLGFCIFTYAESVRIGIMADEEVVADPEALLAGFERELQAAVALSTPVPEAP
ncbi:MAG: putative diacylglycerol O-acyltransferase [Humibacillus sp.]|nr:putative diacylglycerol O-acyltransferase [Humibacillus sp.]